jgi:hypothetical protein
MFLLGSAHVSDVCPSLYVIALVVAAILVILYHGKKKNL